MNMKRICAALIATSVLGFAISGCGIKQKESAKTEASKPTTSVGKKLNVVTTIYPMEAFTKLVGGDKVEVKNLVKPGAEPHDWEPSSQDLIEIQKADLFVYNGSNMEPQMDQILKSIENKKMVVVEASKGLTVPFSEHQHEEIGKDDDEDEHEHEDADHKDADHKDADMHEDEHEGEHHHHHHHDLNALDPHVWLDPVLAAKETEAIANGLIKADPANEAYYKENLTKAIKKFDELNSDYEKTLSNVKSKYFVVTHAAFGYLSKQYNLKEISINGLSPSDEPSPETMADIIKLIKDKHISTIFFETLATPKVAKVIAQETGAKSAELNPIEGLTEDELKAGEDYFSVMKKNLEALKIALN